MAALLALTPIACRQRVDAPAYRGEAACAKLDSVLASAGPARPWSMAGDALLDVDQFRFRGRFRLDVTATGDCTLELGGSTLFGGHREDVVVSLAGDTLRVFDRERGRFYEGDELDALIRESTHADADWSRVVARVFLLPGSCGGIESLIEDGDDGDGVRGAESGATFRLDVEGGRVTRALWPNPIESATFDDRLDVSYRWDGDRIAEATARLPERGWRARLTASK